MDDHDLARKTLELIDGIEANNKVLAAAQEILALKMPETERSKALSRIAREKLSREKSIEKTRKSVLQSMNRIQKLRELAISKNLIDL